VNRSVEPQEQQAMPTATSNKNPVAPTQVLFPKPGQTAKDFLRNKRGLIVLLHVRCEGKQTSVIINIESRTAATWRWIDRKNKGAAALNLDWPGFALTEDTIVLQDAALDALAANDAAVREICMSGSDPGNFVLSEVPMAPAQMDELLRRLESHSDLFRQTRSAGKPVAPR
jgi:hypothetical protein